MVAFEPGGDIHQQGEAGGMRLGKAVLAEAQDLLVDTPGEGLFVAAHHHAVDEPLLEFLQGTAPPPGGDGAAQLVRLASAETGRHLRHLDHLFLEDGYAEGASQHRLHLRRGILHRLYSLAAAQVGMHHVALDGTGADDGHFDHQVIETGRAQPRQHGHLGAGLDLEHPHGVGALDHAVHRRVFSRHVGHPHPNAMKAVDEIEGAADGAQHAQRQAIHLE